MYLHIRENRRLGEGFEDELYKQLEVAEKGPEKPHTRMQRREKGKWDKSEARVYVSSYGVT